MEQLTDIDLKLISEWIRYRRVGTLTAFLNLVHRVFIVDIINNLPEDEEKIYIFDLLATYRAAAIILELNTPSEQVILENLSNEKLSRIIDELPYDDAADMVSDLPKEKAQRLLAILDADDSRKLKELMKYPEDCAGGIMNIEFFRANENSNVTTVLEKLQRMELEEFHLLYVFNDQNRLVGKIDPIKLLLVKGDKKLKEIMNTDVVTVPPEMDQEEVARTFSRYDQISIPVVDPEGHMLGRITVDDIIDVIEEEANEDIYKMAGTADEDELFHAPVLRIAALRLPWLLVTLLGGLITCLLLKSYRATLSQTIALAFFVPIITGMGGNIGIQSSTIVVRGLATGAITLSNPLRILWRELRIGLTMGTICGGLVGLWALVSGEDRNLGLIVGVSMFTAITVAATVGTFTPLALKRFKIDPTVSSGPFVTMTNDITGLIIYFTLATVLLKHLN